MAIEKMHLMKISKILLVDDTRDVHGSCYSRKWLPRSARRNGMIERTAVRSATSLKLKLVIN
jgi:hypothetical protein